MCVEVNQSKSEIMSAPDAAPVSTPKAKKAAKPKKPAAHPKYSEMIAKAVTTLKERGGSSRQAILKHVLANFNVGKDAAAVNSRLKLALRRGVASGALKHAKGGKGASGSFKLGDKAEPKPKKAMKPKAVKPKKAKSPKKPAGEKKAAKPKKAKTPKKAAAAKPKKAKSPKKAKAAKPKAAKPKTPKKVTKPKAKKSPKKAAKKAAKK